MRPQLLVLCGPTACGKTKLAVALAQQYGGEVVSADSMQVYRGMDIGTAKPTLAEREGVPHHMLDVASPAEDYSVARYVAQAGQCVDDILARGKLPILAGGTGLYLDSLLSGRTFAAFSPESGCRAALKKRAETEGMPALLATLARVDPESAQRLHPGDEKRVLRALEVFYETGKTITQHNLETQALPPRYRAVTLGLRFADRGDMGARIDRRVDEMFAQGLEQEVRGLMAQGIPSTATAMQAIGYKEIVAALLGGQPAATGGEAVKLRSRQYAKRQLTWFRRNPETHWITWGKTPDFEAGRRDATAFMEETGIV